jgi:hypothetical protein
MSRKTYGIEKIALEDFSKPDTLTAILDIHSFYKCPRYKKNLRKLLKKLFTSVRDGDFCALISNYQLSKLVKKFGKNETIKLISAIKKDNLSFFYCIIVDLNKYKIPAYEPLYDLLEKKLIHYGDLADIITAIELQAVLVTDDDAHIWPYKRRIRDAFNQRYRKERAQAFIEKRKPPEMEMYDLKDFVQLKLNKK